MKNDNYFKCGYYVTVNYKLLKDAIAKYIQCNISSKSDIRAEKKYTRRRYISCTEVYHFLL